MHDCAPRAAEFMARERWIFLLFNKIVKGIRDEEYLKSDSGRHRSAIDDPPRSRSQATPQLRNNGSELQWGLSPTQNAGATGYDIPNSTPREPTLLPNNQNFPMPLDLLTDWSGVRDEDLWPIPEFDLLGGMPCANKFEGFPGT